MIDVSEDLWIKYKAVKLSKVDDIEYNTLSW